jgi:hypothetical protein
MTLFVEFPRVVSFRRELKRLKSQLREWGIKTAIVRKVGGRVARIDVAAHEEVPTATGLYLFGQAEQVDNPFALAY